MLRAGLSAIALAFFAAACSESPPSVNPDAYTGVCPNVVDVSQFADPARLRALTATMAGFGLRATGSDAHEHLIQWIESELSPMPGMTLRSDTYEIERWQARAQADGARDVERAATLSLVPSGGEAQPISVAGAVPFALPSEGVNGNLVYLPGDTEITAENARGRMIVRDVPRLTVPMVGFLALSRYLTPDIRYNVFGGYERPYTTTNHEIVEEMIAAGNAGAAGVIWVFDVPRDQVAGYWDPHAGMHFSLPAVYVGVDEGEAIKRAASENASAQMSVFAEREMATTRNLIATIPGQSAERIIISVNTDGNTWVQENGVAGAIALADYFAALPIECRPRTLEFAFGSAHLHQSREGTEQYADQINREYDDGSVAFAFAIEHLGTREILARRRSDGPGRQLAFTGKGELIGWFVGDSPPLIQASIDAVKRRGLDRVAIMRGMDPPESGRVPQHCLFGGIGSYFQRRAIPTIGVISGPWSLWAPSFGEEALDFDRMHTQLLVTGDVILAVDDAPIAEIAGDYPEMRRALANGAPGCPSDRYPERAPNFPGD